MRDESPVSFPSLVLTNPELLALQEIFPAPYECVLPPYDSPQEFLEHLLEPSTRVHFTGSFAALASRQGKKHLCTLVSPSSEEDDSILAELALICPEENHPRFLRGGSHGRTLVLPTLRQIVKIRYHAIDPQLGIDDYAQALDIFYDISYESDLTHLLGAFSSPEGLPFVPGVASQVTALSEDAPLVAKNYTFYELLTGKPLGGFLRSDELACHTSDWHLQRFLSDVGFTALLRSQGLIDADRKPANILVARDGRSRYVDLEFVLSPSQLQQRSQNAEGTSSYGPGTLCYMAPERLAGDHSDPLASDIFSLACVYVCGATGKHPFGVRRNDRDVTLVSRIKHDELTDICQDTLRERVPAPLAYICLAALDKDPAQRPTIEDFVRVARQYGDV